MGHRGTGGRVVKELGVGWTRGHRGQDTRMLRGTQGCEAGCAGCRDAEAGCGWRNQRRGRQGTGGGSDVRMQGVGHKDAEGDTGTQRWDVQDVGMQRWDVGGETRTWG